MKLVSGDLIHGMRSLVSSFISSGSEDFTVVIMGPGKGIGSIGLPAEGRALLEVSEARSGDFSGTTAAMASLSSFSIRTAWNRSGDGPTFGR